jgi:hypothetical protein
MWRAIFQAALIIGAVLLYMANFNTGALFCVLALVWSALQQKLARLAGIVTRLVNVPEEHDTNVVLTYTFGLAARGESRFSRTDVRDGRSRDRRDVES